LLAAAFLNFAFSRLYWFFDFICFPFGFVVALCGAATIAVDNLGGLKEAKPPGSRALANFFYR
jgi:hypothetical protein